MTDTPPGHGPRTGHRFFPRASQVALVVKNLPANAGDARDVGYVPEVGRSPGVGNGNPLQYSCLEHATDSGAWQARVHGVTKSWTQLSDGAHTAHMCEHTQLPYVAGPQEPLYRKAKKGTHADCYHQWWRGLRWIFMFSLPFSIASPLPLHPEPPPLTSPPPLLSPPHTSVTDLNSSFVSGWR